MKRMERDQGADLVILSELMGVLRLMEERKGGRGLEDGEKSGEGSASECRKRLGLLREVVTRVLDGLLSSKD
jgi:hypothetical protein